MIDKKCPTCGKKMLHNKCYNCDSKSSSKQYHGPSVDKCGWYGSGGECPMAVGGSGDYCRYHSGCQSEAWGDLATKWIKKNWIMLCKATKNTLEFDMPVIPKKVKDLEKEVNYPSNVVIPKTRVDQMYDNNPALLKRIREADSVSEKIAICAMALDDHDLDNNPVMNMVKAKLNAN